ncbi:hypothetical protein HBB16_01945 [Pseudonocardia sp. MCCB 268]|nr:hypothetical protein [Pseudonocardia cytotoxica]
MTDTDVAPVPQPPFDPELELVLTTMSDEAPLVMTAEMIRWSARTLRSS